MVWYVWKNICSCSQNISRTTGFTTELREHNIGFGLFQPVQKKLSGWLHLTRSMVFISSQKTSLVWNYCSPMKMGMLSSAERKVENVGSFYFSEDTAGCI